MKSKLSENQNKKIDDILKHYDVKYGQSKAEELQKFEQELDKLRQWLLTNDKIPTPE